MFEVIGYSIGLALAFGIFGVFMYYETWKMERDFGRYPKIYYGLCSGNDNTIGTEV